jgi:hypothetical protein
LEREKRRRSRQYIVRRRARSFPSTLFSPPKANLICPEGERREEGGREGQEARVVADAVPKRKTVRQGEGEGSREERGEGGREGVTHRRPVGRIIDFRGQV